MGAQWKNKHKSDTAAAKGKIFTKLAKEIMMAAKNGADRRDGLAFFRCDRLHHQQDAQRQPPGQSPLAQHQLELGGEQATALAALSTEGGLNATLRKAMPEVAAHLQRFYGPPLLA